MVRALLNSIRYSHHFASSCSIALSNSSESGSTPDLKRLTTLPCLSTRNFSKFQPTSPDKSPFQPPDVRNEYRGCLSEPFTEIFSNMSNVTLNFVEQNSLISSFVPGSCPPKLFAGKPRILNPFAL